MFIAIEGIDGSGKSTLAGSLEKVLSSYNYRVFSTYEPTDKFKENQEFLEKAGREEPLLLLSLFLKDRIDHSKEIEAKLEAGNIVICDRYSLSTFAYQGSMLKNNFKDEISWIKWMENALGIVHLVPELTIYLDLDPKEFLARKKENRQYEMFENEEYLRSVHDAYRKAIDHNILSKSFHICDARLPRNQVLECALEGIRRKTNLLQ
jgi:dTMP kinase